MVRGVHWSVQVGFVPNSDMTRPLLVGEMRSTHHLSRRVIGSKGLGLIGCQVGVGRSRVCGKRVDFAEPGQDLLISRERERES